MTREASEVITAEEVGKCEVNIRRYRSKILNMEVV